MGFRLLHTPGAHEPCHVGIMFDSYVFLSCADSIPAQLGIVHILGCSGPEHKVNLHLVQWQRVLSRHATPFREALCSCRSQHI